MKALIIGQYVNLGGTQHLAYQVIEVLKKLGYDIDLITGKENNFLPDNYSRAIKTGYPYYQNQSRIGILRNMKKLQAELKTKILEKYELTFNNHPNTFLYKADINFLHGPSFVDSLITEQGRLKKNALFYILKYGRIYRIYDGAYFLTHGKYTRRLSEQLLPQIGIRPERIDYIYTPVQTNFIVDLNAKKKNVLVFGRIMPDKDLENVMKCAEQSKYKFLVAGFVSKTNLNYLEKLDKIKPDNVQIIPNPDDQLKRELYQNSWTYFHTKPMEHFGVSAAEAISYGCVPVVPKSGGVWEDITESGEFGLGYNDIDEASQKISESFDLTYNERLRIYESRSRFSFENFESKLVDIVSSIVS